jgi:hypothetical protein
MIGSQLIRSSATIWIEVWAVEGNGTENCIAPIRCTIVSVAPGPAPPPSMISPSNGSEPGPKKPSGIGVSAKSACVAPHSVVQQSYPGDITVQGF